MAVQAEAATSLLPGRPEEARRSVEIIGDTARQALTELRRLLGVLRGRRTAGDGALGVARRAGDGARPGARGRAAGRPRGGGHPGPLAPGVDLTAYRIIQEALTNTIRHARAARAAVTLCYEPGYITVSVTDSGRRPDGLPAAARQRTGPPAGLAAHGAGSRVSAWPASRSGSPPAAAT